MGVDTDLDVIPHAGRTAALLVALILASAALAAAEDAKAKPADAFSAALTEMGITESDLGYRPLGHWNRYPHPNTIPYVMPFFTDLFAHPLDTYEFARTLGNAVEDALTPTALQEKPDALFRLGVVLATERRIGGFRAYSANVDPHPATDEPLLQALTALLERTGQPLPHGLTFGKPVDEHQQDPVSGLRAELAKIPAALHLPLAKLVLNLLDAHAWIDLGLRRVPQDLRDAVFDTVPQLADATPDGSRYFPAIDDVARLLDEHSLWYGCLKTLQAVQDARRELGAVAAPADGWPEFDFRMESPWGTVAFDHHPQKELQVDDPLLIVRISSPGALRGIAGATASRRPLSVALLLDSADQVGCAPDSDLTECRSAALASGVLGCGVVYSSGDHSTTYRTREWGMGAGLFGLGALIDEGGNDDYRMLAGGMGAGFFGAGLLLDAAGDDHYVLDQGDGQGLGGPGGIGVLADRSGNDSYYVEPDATKAGRADYHADYAIATSNAQGAGIGRRGDGSDGHAWAGGLGALIDVDGNDTYQSGDFSLGVGYWYGTGIVWDGGGNDEYRSVFYTQGAGAHFAIGALIDEGGDDAHLLQEHSGAALGFGWDVVNAFLIDRGQGNDRYDAKIDAIGLATMRSNAVFLDDGGNDTYILDVGARGDGQVDQQDTYATPGRTATFNFHIPQVGLFLDCGGKDTYLRRQKDGTLVADVQARDDRTWQLQKRDAAARSGANVSVGKDIARGRIGFLDAWPARQAESHGAITTPQPSAPH